jgi:TonB-linked SusC/RagA family outer membrane protein
MSIIVGHFKLQAQAIQVSGTVTDAKTNEALPGVSIGLQGSTKGTISDVDGKYTIEVPDANATLVFSFVSYVTETVPVNGRAQINVSLVPDIKNLDEVVVVGYGTSKKSDLTGAVSSLSADDLRNSVVTNFDQALQGRIAGVQVTQNSGQPDGALSIRIRGINSITGSNEPLYVIDGVQMRGDGKSIIGFDWEGGENGQNRVNPLSGINPSDIVNIEVLKDASAAAIYGAQGANGVIIVTTKRGQKGAPKVSYNGYMAIQSVPKTLKMMNLPEYANYEIQIQTDLGLTKNNNYLDPTLLGAGTDWQKAIFQVATAQSHQLSVSGGTDKSTYAVSGSYLDNPGIIVGSGFNRYTGRVHFESEVKKWLKVGSTMNFSKRSETITLNDGSGGVIMQALQMQPDVPVKNFDGTYAGPGAGLAGMVSYNPVWEALDRTNTLDQNESSGNFYINAELIKGLTLRSEVNLDVNSSVNKAFNPTFTIGTLSNKQNQMRELDNSSFYWGWSNYLTYDVKLGGKHSLKAMLGEEEWKSTWRQVTTTKFNFASNDIQDMNQGSNQSATISGGSDATSMLSYYGRVFYDYGGRYSTTLTLRRDGSSKFGPQNKWGYFPAGSVAWRISNENFMKGISAISNLKLRLSYGLIGNTPGTSYLFGSSMAAQNTALGTGTGYIPGQIANPALQWESTATLNLGVDLSLFKDRISLTVDAYQKHTNKLLLQLNPPAYLSSGPNVGQDIVAPMGNVGSLENKGFEIALTTRNIETKKFDWTTSFNFTLNRNKVTALDQPNAAYWSGLYWYPNFQNVTITKVGNSLGDFYGYKTMGLFKNQQDILNWAVQYPDPATATAAMPQGSKNLVNKTQGVWIGDVKYKDLNGDGVITSADQGIIGNPNPKWTGGLNNAFTYGPFDLNIMLTYSFGGQIFNYSRVVLEGQTSVYNNQLATVADRAQYAYYDANGSITDPANVYLANPGASVPRTTNTDINGNNKMSDRWIEDGSYLRIQNISLAYTLPGNLTQKIKIERVRVYINAQNVYTFTKYSGYDPEIGAYNQDSRRQNIDMGRYPTPRIITCGLDVDF